MHVQSKNYSSVELHKYGSKILSKSTSKLLKSKPKL